DKPTLFANGYISPRSSHERGSTVDVSLIRLGAVMHAVKISERLLTNGEWIPFLDDGTVDMGSSFDLFHEASHSDATLIPAEAKHLRSLLSIAMQKEGFETYAQEWWHFS